MHAAGCPRLCVLAASPRTDPLLAAGDAILRDMHRLRCVLFNFSFFHKYKLFANKLDMIIYQISGLRVN